MCPELKPQRSPSSRRSQYGGGERHADNSKMLVRSAGSVSCSVVSDSLQPHGLQHARLLCPWDFPGKNIGVGCHFFLQGVFLTQGSNSCLLHWQADSLSFELSVRICDLSLKKCSGFFFFFFFCQISIRCQEQGLALKQM